MKHIKKKIVEKLLVQKFLSFGLVEKPLKRIVLNNAKCIFRAYHFIKIKLFISQVFIIFGTHMWHQYVLVVFLNLTSQEESQIAVNLI